MCTYLLTSISAIMVENFNCQDVLQLQHPCSVQASVFVSPINGLSCPVCPVNPVSMQCQTKRMRDASVDQYHAISVSVSMTS